ncbi:MAG TPA: hypothetical protein VIG90_14060 [Pedomonas sp.]|uniref:hypothetical protein n=1 Tax=Pedomonas sp. TaxID=2976421 RepID=UPI002F41D77E
MAGETQDTGTSDSTYDLVSVLYHCLQGVEMYEVYAADAEDDEELARFFEEITQQERERAERAKQLLAARLNRS